MNPGHSEITGVCSFLPEAGSAEELMQKRKAIQFNHRQGSHGQEGKQIASLYKTVKNCGPQVKMERSGGIEEWKLSHKRIVNGLSFPVFFYFFKRRYCISTYCISSVLLFPHVISY